MIHQATVDKLEAHLTECVKKGTSRYHYCTSKGLGVGYFKNSFTKLHKEWQLGNVDNNQYNRIVELLCKLDVRYAPYKSDSKADHWGDAKTVLKEEKHYDSLEAISDEEADDERNKIEYVRGKDGKIQCYKFTVRRRDREPLSGTLSREDANKIFRLYSYYGQALTQREISREFPEYSLMDFKRILRVFNITKASADLAPHVIEEHTQEELMQIRSREKENDYLRSVERQRIKDTEKKMNELALENAKLKQQIHDGRNIIAGITIKGGNSYQYAPSAGKATIMIYLSDMHIGASVADESIYKNPYNRAEAERRLQLIYQRVADLKLRYGTFKEIVVCNLGDSLDGQDHKTVRRDHDLPQNMTNKEQVENYLSIMNRFFTNLASICNSLRYICVGDSNHDGVFGWLTNLALVEHLRAKGVKAYLAKKAIEHIYVDNHCFILFHGKDGINMKKNWPLTIDLKTENFINEYMDANNIHCPTTVVKGDLHQSAISYARRFEYKSVGSMFGSSEWIHMNFGNTPAACDYSILDTKDILHGRIVLNQ